jgi:hypothetical protein
MIPELIEMFHETKLVSKEQYESMHPLKKPYGEKLGDFLLKNGISTKNVLKNFLDENKDSLLKLFKNWLNENSEISNAIKWQTKNKKNSFRTWKNSDKIELSNELWKKLLNVQKSLPEAPESTVNLNENGKILSTDINPKDAWKYYLAYVSHCLVVELDKLVHWSILKYNESQLNLLLDSKSLFEYSESEDIYSISRWNETLFNHGATTPGDPTRIYDFLSKEELIGITRIDSIGRLLGWCRTNMYKVTDKSTPQNYSEYWQYEGYPPVERIIKGTNHPELGFHHFTAGCWVTAGFLRGVLRTINIPVALEERCNHALPSFTYNNHKFYLSHGDDPYNKLYKITTFQFPPSDLLIDHNKFESWFDKKLPEETICNNVGKHAFELILEYLPDEILKEYCDDTANGRTPENGRIYNEIFKDHMSLDDLKRFGLWDRLKMVIEERGGCEIFSEK